MRKYNPKVPTSLKNDILKLFYRTELRQDEEVIDNRDSKIARELGTNQYNVQSVISADLDKKIDKINNK